MYCTQHLAILRRDGGWGDETREYKERSQSQTPRCRATDDLIFNIYRKTKWTGKWLTRHVLGDLKPSVFDSLRPGISMRPTPTSCCRHSIFLIIRLNTGIHHDGDREGCGWRESRLVGRKSARAETASDLTAMNKPCLSAVSHVG